MKQTLRIKLDLGIENISTKSGKTYVKHHYVGTTTDDQHPKDIKFSFFGETDKFVLNVNGTYDISFDLESREFNGRWYTDVTAWRADEPQSKAPQPQPQTPAPVQQPAPAPSSAQVQNTDPDLPF